MRYVRFALVTLALLAPVTGRAEAAQLEWVRSLEQGIVDTSAVVADVDGKEGEEIVLCSTAGFVLVWDSEGNELWSHQVGEEVTVPPTVADIDGRPGLEICALDNDGTVVCLNSKGGPLWQYQFPAGIEWGCTTVVVRDVDKDGSQDLIAADSAGHVVCLNRRGKVKWQYDCIAGVNTPLAVADLDGQGGDEVVFASDDGCIRCVSDKGRLLWSFQTDGACRSGPVIGDIDREHGLEVLAGSGGGTLWALSGSGSLLWRFDTGAEIDSCISVGDLDDDGQQDVLVGNLRGDLFRLTASGTERWRYDAGMRSRRPPAMADLYGDGEIEILLGNYSEYLRVLTAKGEVREKTPLGGAMNATPAVADLNGDGRLEAVCPTTAGEVRCYSWYTTASRAHPKTLWPMYRFDTAQTASPANAVRASDEISAHADYGTLLVGANEFRVEVSNPGEEALRIGQTITVRGSGASSQRVTESAEPQIAASLTYEVDGRAARDIQFSYTVSNRDSGKRLLEGGKSFYITPFANDVATIGDLIAGLQTDGSIEPDTADYLTRQRDYFSSRLHQLEGRIALATSFDEATFSELKRAVIGTSDELRTLNLLRRIATEQHERGKSKLVVWSANPWAPFAGIDDLPAEIPDAAHFDMDVYRGEYESAAFNVANLSPKPLTIRVHMEKMARKSAADDEGASLNPYDYFTLHEVAAVPTVRGNYSADAVPRLNQGRLLTLPPWSARQIWLIFFADDLDPDTYSTALVLKSLELEPITATCDLTARVRSIALPKPSPLKFCNWGYVYGSVIRDFEEEARDDLVSHGTNVFVITTYHTPAAQFDSTGALVGTIDYNKHDFIVNLYKDHGLLMFFNYQTVLKGRDGDPYMSPAWKKAYAAWLKQWVAHLQELGVGYSGFALYPVDEPGLHHTGRSLIDKFIEIGKLTREVDPKIQIYTDPVAGARLEHLKEMAPYVDIWCPNRNAIVLAKNDPRLEYLQSTGKPVWTYECEGNAKEQPPLVYYRGQAWLAWHYGLTGIGFWSYCTSAFDPWFRPVGDRANDYLLIYQGDGVVTSKRWEACRDGVEDYGALWELRRLAVLGKERGVDKALLDSAARLIETAAADVATWSYKPHASEYRRNPKTVAEHDWGILRGYRTQIAELTEQIQDELSTE